MPRIKKQDIVKNYAEESEFFTDDNDALKNATEEVEKNKKYISWVQEFSKKIVIIVFILYIAMSIITMGIAIYNSSGVDTIITEINTTFREVVGGYIIKAAIENAVKIGGNYYVGVADAKLKAMKKRMRINDDSSIVENEEE